MALTGQHGPGSIAPGLAVPLRRGSTGAAEHGAQTGTLAEDDRVELLEGLRFRSEGCASRHAGSGVPDAWSAHLTEGHAEGGRRPGPAGYPEVGRLGRGARVRSLALPDLDLPVHEIPTWIRASPQPLSHPDPEGLRGTAAAGFRAGWRSPVPPPPVPIPAAIQDPGAFVAMPRGGC